MLRWIVSTAFTNIQWKPWSSHFLKITVCKITHLFKDFSSWFILSASQMLLGVTRGAFLQRRNGKTLTEFTNRQTNLLDLFSQSSDRNTLSSLPISLLTSPYFLFSWDNSKMMGAWSESRPAGPNTYFGSERFRKTTMSLVSVKRLHPHKEFSAFFSPC